MADDAAAPVLGAGSAHERAPGEHGADGRAPMSLADAYRHCEALTREQAANFYWGIRLLPGERRRAMCAVYAFARRVDDVGDGEMAGDAPPAHERRLSELGAQAQALARLPGEPGSDPVMIALADAYRRFDVPRDALPALIDGVRMDVEQVAYESFDDLVLYCRRVAGAIGRACLAIFALRDPSYTGRVRAAELADDLGVALQLTNILRDLREDAENGRVYLPAEDLRRFGAISVGEHRSAAQAIAGTRPLRVGGRRREQRARLGARARGLRGRARRALV